MLRPLVLFFLLAVFLQSNPTIIHAQSNDCAESIQVQKGESLSLLALRYFGSLMAYPTIVELTNTLAKRIVIADPNKINAGQRVCLSTLYIYPARAIDPQPGARSAPGAAGETLGNGGYHVQSYLVDLEWSPPNVITATASILLRATQDLSNFSLDLHGFTVTRLSLNGNYPPVQRVNDKLIIYLLKPLANNDIFDVQVQYNGVPAPITSGSRTRGWTMDSSGGVTVCNQPFGSSSWFPSNELAGARALYFVNVTVPMSYKVIREPDNKPGKRYAETPISGDSRILFPISPRSPAPGGAPNFAIHPSAGADTFVCPGI